MSCAFKKVSIDVIPIKSGGCTLFPLTILPVGRESIVGVSRPGDPPKTIRSKLLLGENEEDYPPVKGGHDIK